MLKEMTRVMAKLALGASLSLTAGCLNQGTIEETGTTAVITPAPTAPDPDSLVCDPFDPDQGGTNTEQGVHGSLYYLTAGQPQYSQVADYIANGTHVSDVDLFFNQLYVPTRPFDRGFVTQGGQALLMPDGNTLYEWFAIQFMGRLKLGASDAPGLYQLAVLSDDGAMLRLDDGAGNMNTLLANDGNHPTRMACATQALDLAAGEKIPFELDYHQGPRYHIALILMWRPWPTNPSDVNDPLCGQQGNSLYFDSTQDPPTPKPAYNQLLARGWKPLNPDNYVMPAQQTNPCNDPAPIISNVATTNITRTSVTLTWTTNNPATSQAGLINNSNGQMSQTTEDTSLVTSHVHLVSGLTPNTPYQIKAMSRSSSGQLTESGYLTFRTAR